MWKRQCSSLVSSARTSLLATPALLTRISTRPCSAIDGGGGLVHVLRLGDVEGDARGLQPQLLQRGDARLHAVGHHLGDDHLGARLGQRLRAGEADALSAAGDHGDAVVQLQFFEIHDPVPSSTHPIAAVDIVGLGDDVIAFGRGEEDRAARHDPPAGPCGRRAPPRRRGASSRRAGGLRTWRTVHRPRPTSACRRRRARCR